MKNSDSILREALIEKRLIEKEALDRFIVEAEAPDSNLVQALVRSGLFLEEKLLSILAGKLNISFITLSSMQVNKELISKIPTKIALYYKFIPISIKDRVLVIAVSYPLDIKKQDEIRTQLGYDIEMALASRADISDSIQKYYGLAADMLGKISAQPQRAAMPGDSHASDKMEDIESLAGDASVIKLVNQIVLEAYRKRATDIHIEPYRGSVSLRYRIDGLLYDANVPPEIKNFLNAIISRIKIMSNLNIVERRLPQDGRAVVKVQDDVLDLRISTIPTPYGESVVIRILPTQMLFSLAKLGLSKKEMQTFEGLIQKPHGVIFVTGPTGSGKTTTLYTCLSKINTKERKIITIEDPIEYEMSGITQIQVTPEIGLDFARGLRSILRHDPDVIMVGEVRDKETAEIAIRVALTGHLVFSTLHTNDAASGITRLIDIGVEPYLVASSVEAFIAQRLIRTICPDCKYEDKDAPDELKELISEDLGLRSQEVKISRGKGCVNCNHTGFWGRTAIYEILLVDEDIKDLIIKKVSSGQINKVAISKGMKTLRMDGWNKVIAGLSTPEEVMNITNPSKEEEAKDNAHFADFSNSSGMDNKDSGGYDKRAYKRLDNKINIRYKIFGAKGSYPNAPPAGEKHSVSKNLSAGGLLFISDEPFSIGTNLEMIIEIPDVKEPLECLARVIRVEEIAQESAYDVAVCFLDITGAQRARLEKYVAGESKK